MQPITYHRFLPHIHPDGHPIFVTMRLADSLPKEIMNYLSDEYQRELNLTGNNAEKKLKAGKRYFVNFDEQLDKCQYGPTWLSDPAIAKMVTTELHAIDGQYLDLMAYCIMPNHVHLLATNIRNPIEDNQPFGAVKGDFPLTQALQQLKGRSARFANQALNRSGSFWQRESYDYYARTSEETQKIVSYIANNPVKAGLCNSAIDYPFTYIKP